MYYFLIILTRHNPNNKPKLIVPPPLELCTLSEVGAGVGTTTTTTGVTSTVTLLVVLRLVGRGRTKQAKKSSSYASKRATSEAAVGSPEHWRGSLPAADQSPTRYHPRANTQKHHWPIFVTTSS